jgi:hypothetical protein
MYWEKVTKCVGKSLWNVSAGFPGYRCGAVSLNDTLMRKPFEVRLLINAPLREGSIVKLDTGREGGPFNRDLFPDEHIHSVQVALWLRPAISPTPR